MSNESFFSSWVRPHVRALRPYTSARDEFSGVARAALDANENPLGHPAVGASWARYPDPHQHEITARLATLRGVRPEQILVTNGSDEAIDLLVRAGCQPREEAVMICPPTYGMYAVTAAAHDVPIRSVPLKTDFQPDADAILAQAAGAKLLFLTSPNNPTGNLLDPQLLAAIIGGFPGVVVIDEAYADFADAPSWTTRLPDFPNLVVLQTLSKAWGLAGLRVGVLFADPALVSYLRRLKPPYNVSGVSQELAARALADAAGTATTVARVLLERQRLADALAESPLISRVFPSDANFLLVKTMPDASLLYEALLARGVVVRNRSREPGCGNCLRISVGTPAENDRLLAALQTVTPAMLIPRTA